MSQSNDEASLHVTDDAALAKNDLAAVPPVHRLQIVNYLRGAEVRMLDNLGRREAVAKGDALDIIDRHDRLRSIDKKAVHGGALTISKARKYKNKKRIKK